MELFIKQSGKCFYCGEMMQISSLQKPLYATFDHVFPKSKGRKWTKDNLVLCHQKCNQIKADKVLNFITV